MNSVVKSVAYTLAHAPDLLVHCGATQTTERIVNPEAEYLKVLPNSLRSFESSVNYAANQAYIGNITPAQLSEIPMPWHQNSKDGANRFGKFGEIIPQQELYLLMAACDSFDLVMLEGSFVKAEVTKTANHPLLADIFAKLKTDGDIAAIEKAVKQEGAEGLYQDNKLIGCVKKAHDVDENLNAHIILENLVSKATSVISLLNLVKNAGISKNEIDLVIDCSEEAVGDMNQRGGGNMAKAAAEVAGFVSATGHDLRAFCAAPTHAIISAAAMVKSGTFKNVVVTAGGSTAKLGMNGKDHVKKGVPLLEDVVGGFAVLISYNDGVSPEILSESVGWHAVGSGSAPQAVITALVTNPLDKMGLKITDIDKYSPEMHNPDLGIGDVAGQNYKMIGALAVTRGEIERADLANFAAKHGMSGFAPTQGHIPSGVPYLGFGREDIMSGKIERAMIIGKGSLFLGRMTNLFDGASFVVQKNSGASPAAAFDEGQVKSLIAEALRDFAKTLGGE